MEGYILSEEQIKRFGEDIGIKAYTIDMIKKKNNYYVVLDGKYKLETSKEIYYKYEK